MEKIENMVQEILQKNNDLLIFDFKIKHRLKFFFFFFLKG